MKKFGFQFKGLILCLLLPIGCWAAKPYLPVMADPMFEPWRWKHVEALDGLGVLCMGEAKDGSLWFGNVGGLTHYDGVNVKQIPFDENLSQKRSVYNSPTPWTISLCVLRDGTPLLVVEQSLIRWVNGAWDVVMEDVGWAENSFVERLIQTEDGTVWLMMPNQLIRLSEDLSKHQVIWKTEGRNQLVAFCSDSHGGLWVVETVSDQAQLVHLSFSADRSSVVPVRRSYPIPFYQPTREIRVVAGQDGMIWCADSSGDTEFQAFDPKQGAWCSREKTGIGTGYYSLFKSRDGTLWGGGHGFLYALRRGQELIYPAVQLGLPAIPLSLYGTSDGRYWVIGRIGQVYCVDVSSTEWMTYQRLSYQAQSAEGNQWYIEKNRSLVVSYDPAMGRWVRYGQEDHGLDIVDRLLVTRQGLVWAAGRAQRRAAIAVWNGTEWTHFDHAEFAQAINPNAVFEAQDGSVWFGAGDGYLADVPFAGGALQYGVNEKKEVRCLKHYSPPNFPYFVTTFAQTPDQTLWVGSTVVHRYDRTSINAVPVPLFPMDNTTDMVVDAENNLWIAKIYFGLYQQQGSGWRKFTTTDGLASLVMTDLLLLKDGSLLVASDKGISRFDGKTWTPHAFSEWFAMRSKWAGLRQSADGSIWLNFTVEDSWTEDAGVRQTEAFCTVRYRAETNPPDTEITEYLDRVAQPGNTHITWSAKDPWGSSPKNQLQFSWRLNGGEWSAFSHDTGRTFLNLDSGKHLLEVRSRDRAFNIDPSPARCEFVVEAPLWQQAWFLTMMALFSGAILFLTRYLIRTREQHLLERQHEREAFLLNQQADREEHLKEIDRLKTGFFTNISHELRTPMTVILGPLEMMLTAETDPKKRNMLALMVRNAQRVTTLISQLLDFRKIEEGRIGIVVTYGDLVPNVQEWAASLQPLADKAQLVYRLESVEECRGWFDFDKLQKIFTNLISNSIKYTKAGGEVRVILQEENEGSDGHRVRFVVEDSGVGIAAEHLEHIFDRFYRVSETSMAVGAGIGLNLTKELIDLLGGEVHVESPISSDEDRPGTRFSVYLPIHQRDRPDGAVERPEFMRNVVIESSAGRSVDSLNPVQAVSSLDQSEKPLILIVEDDADIRTFLLDGLQSSYRIEMAADGAIGLRLAREHLPDLVITDWMMPIMDGVTLCRELKADETTSHIPIIMLTAKTALENQVVGFHTGADDYVTKPFHMILLQARIQNLLESRRVLRE